MARNGLPASQSPAFCDSRTKVPYEWDVVVCAPAVGAANG